jgi:hypothetical protein
MAAAAWSSGCDQGTPHDAPTRGRTFIRVLGANVGPGKPADTRGKIEIAFDRLLDPQTIVRQSFPLRDAAGNVVASPIVQYDPVTRVVTLANPDVTGSGKPWLDDDQFYTVTVGLPRSDDDNGVRAIDRATLDPSAPASARTISFFACAASGSQCAPGLGAPVIAPPVPVVSFCDDIFPLFEAENSKIAQGSTYRGHCSGSACHAAVSAVHLPAAGLVLQTPEGVAAAIDKPAQGSVRAAKADESLPASRVFGVNMPIIHRGSPGTSWLLYKLLLAAPPDPASVPKAQRKECYANSMSPALHAFPTPAAFAPLSDAERRILSDYVLGREMPYPSHPRVDPDPKNDNYPLTIDEMERVGIWIEQGAPVDLDCGGNNVPSCYGARDSEPLLCRAAFSDCNRQKLDGCEVNLRCDPLHCGACDVVCAPADACVHGVCGAALDGGADGDGGGACDPAPLTTDAGRD